MKGDLVAVEIRQEAISDGAGGEALGHVCRIWGEDEEGEDALMLTLSMLDRSPAAVPEFKRFVDFWLSVWEIEG